MNTATSEITFAAFCSHRAQLLNSGDLALCEVVDEMQAVAEQSGLVAEIGQDVAQRIMGEAIAAATLVPEFDEPDELDEACEREIMLRIADLVREWELADPRDRWRHTGEHRPPVVRPERPRAPSYTPPRSTVDAFWHVVRLNDPDYLTRWLASHPADAPELFKLWKKPC